MFPKTTRDDAWRLIGARGLRAIGDGFVSILLPAYLLALGHTPLEVGILATATLLGSAALTLFVGAVTARFGHKRPLLAAAGLMIATGVGFAGFEAFWPLLAIAFVGTLNPSSGDVSVFLPLEQSLLSRSVAEEDRTKIFAYYSLAGSLMGAVGTLCAAVPGLAARGFGTPVLGATWGGVTELGAMRAMFLVYAAAGVIAALIYRRIEDPGHMPQQQPAAPLGPSRSRVYKLAVLFGVDAFGGGFIVQSILVLWLFQTFKLPVSAAATLFFWTNLCAAGSYLAAVPIARRIGLVRTMVFTHLPSSVFLLLIPFMPNLALVIGLLIARSLLSSMDVPTRTSYVMAVVSPHERPAAASLTSVPRSLAAAVSPVLSGLLITVSPFGWPLLIGGSLKIGYDLALLYMFQHIRPAEEQERPAPTKS